MKTPKLMMAGIAVFVFSNLLFSCNPNIETADDIAKNIVGNLNNQGV